MKSRFINVDVLRGFAVLGVVAVHTSQYFSAGSSFLDNILSSGRFGVQLFFLLSAYSLSISWSNTRLKYSTNSKIVDFYIKRATKIVPLFFIAIVVYLSFNKIKTVSWLELISLFSFTFVWFPTTITNIVPGSWSIGLEVLFYIMFPFLVFRFINKKIYLLLFLWFFTFNALAIEPVIKSALERDYFTDVIISNYLYLNPFNQLSVFFLGLYLYFYPNFKNIRYEIVSIFIVSLVLFINQFLRGSLYKNTGLLFFIVLLLLVIFFRYMINLDIKRAFYINVLGRFSYEIYFAHFLVLQILSRFYNPEPNFYTFILFFFTTVIICFVVAHMLNYIFFKPIEKIVYAYFR